MYNYFRLMSSVSRCTQIIMYKKKIIVYTIISHTLQLSVYHSYFEKKMHTVFKYLVLRSCLLFWLFFSKLVLVWARILRGTVPRIYSSKYSSAVLCLQSRMGRVSYLLPPSIWVELDLILARLLSSLLRFFFKTVKCRMAMVHTFLYHKTKSAQPPHQALSSSF